MFDAYLDIETTGLSSRDSQITVIGLYLVNSGGARLVQLVGQQVEAGNLLEELAGVRALYTYNGSRFDLPFINAVLGINLAGLCAHHDLMYDCWQRHLRGGFKAVERQLGIGRQLQGITGWDAVVLWRRYCNRGDQNALAMLLQYNKEDVVNLKALREKLGVHPSGSQPIRHDPRPGEG